jgi:hypothetical protein
MSNKIACVFTAGLCLLGFGVATAAAQGSPQGEPAVPADLEVPAGQVLFLTGHAIGTQNYMCLPAAKGVAWRFLAPEATLFQPSNTGVGQQITTHFLSGNPIEAGLARPTWQDSDDSSRVWGRVKAPSTDPNYVAPGAIPWLLVEVVGAALGPTGGSRLASATYIQRVHTVGGVAPSGGCSKSGDIGALTLVPYETDYYFYRANQ